ncbi:MAG: response regulator [Blastocatellia bacterium]|nr:response regulator [Blastocatellia bacterium]
MKKILIADDTEEVVDSLQEMLSPYYEVDVARSGFEVLELCEQVDYECVILDINFEYGVSGLEVASTLRSNNNQVSILIFSATGYTQAIRQYVVDIGATFCEKPLDLDFIHKMLRKQENEQDSL